MAMREKQFIEQNKADWQKLWQKADYPLIKKVSEHASFARTFFPNRKVSEYLNDLVVSVWLKKKPNTRIQNENSFWLHELPLLVHEHRISLRISLLIFVFAIIVGMVSSSGEGAFLSTILGEDYVEMTFENIRSGDPMKIYKQKNQMGMAAGITANNLFISLLMYVLGLIGGLGSIGLLISNGVLVGSFQYLFISEGFFKESFLTIWTHGLPEITAIILSGGAGLVLGKGVISGNARNFKKSAKDGFKILLGIVPILIFAGFAEGYLTRFTDAPDALRIGFIVVCLIFILIYFVWFPSVKNQWMLMEKQEPIIPEQMKGYEKQESRAPFYKVRSAEDILKLSLRWIDRELIYVLVGCSMLFLVFTAWGQGLSEMVFPNKILGMLSHIDQFFKNPIQWLILSFIHGYITIRFYEKTTEGSRSRRNFWIFILPAGFFTGMMGLNHALTPILILFLAPIYLLIINYWWLKEKWKIIEVIQFIRGQTLRIINLQLNLFIVAIILIAVFDTYFIQFTLQTLTGFLPDYINAATSISKGILTFTFLFLVYGIYSLMLIAMCWMTGTLLEIKTGRGLKSRIKQWLPMVLFLFAVSEGRAQSAEPAINFDKSLWQKESEEMDFFKTMEVKKEGYLNELMPILEGIAWDWILYILSALLIISGMSKLIIYYLASNKGEVKYSEEVQNVGEATRSTQVIWTKQELDKFRKNQNWLELIRAYHAEILRKNKVSLTTTNREFENQFASIWKRQMARKVNSLFEKTWYGRDSRVTKKEWDDFLDKYEQLNKLEDED